MNTTRRSFLGGLAVASALTSAAAAQAATSPSEHSELLALGEEFERAHRAFVEIDERLPDLQAAYRAIAPSGDGVVFLRLPNHLRRFAGMVNDPACPGCSKWKTPRGDFYYVVQAYYLDAEIDADQIENDCYAKRLRKLAVKYQQDVEEAKKATGLDVLLEQWTEAQWELRRIVSSLCEIRARTPMGIALKIKATTAYASIGSEEKFTARLWISDAIWNDLGEDA